MGVRVSQETSRVLGASERKVLLYHAARFEGETLRRRLAGRLSRNTRHQKRESRRAKKGLLVFPLCRAGVPRAMTASAAPASLWSEAASASSARSAESALGSAASGDRLHGAAELGGPLATRRGDARIGREPSQTTSDAFLDEDIWSNSDATRTSDRALATAGARRTASATATAATTSRAAWRVSFLGVPLGWPTFSFSQTSEGLGSGGSSLGGRARASKRFTHTRGARCRESASSAAPDGR